MVRLFELFGCAPSPTKNTTILVVTVTGLFCGVYTQVDILQCRGSAALRGKAKCDCYWAGGQRKVYISLLWNLYLQLKVIHKFIPFSCKWNVHKLDLHSFICRVLWRRPRMWWLSWSHWLHLGGQREKHHVSQSRRWSLTSFKWGCLSGFPHQKFEVLNLTRLFGVGSPLHKPYIQLI